MATIKGKPEEVRRLESKSRWYEDDQLDIDKRLIRLRYESIRPFCKGPTGLEMGPAEGLMSHLLVREFDDLTVVEGSKRLLDQIPDYENLNKVHALFEEYDPGRTFGTVILYYVLEHVKDPVELLAQVKTWVAPGGRMVIGVPNAHSIHRLVAVKMGLLEKPWQLNRRDHALGHRRVYTWDVLSSHVEEAGLQIVERTGVFFKPLSNKQIQEQWTEEMVQGFYELGKEFPDNAADLVVLCQG